MENPGSFLQCLVSIWLIAAVAIPVTRSRSRAESLASSRASRSAWPMVFRTQGRFGTGRAARPMHSYRTLAYVFLNRRHKPERGAAMSPAVRSPARFRFVGIAFFAILAACSGGSGGGGSNGGGSGGSRGGVIPPTTFSVSGTIVDAGTNGGTGAGISGATVALYVQNVALTTPIVSAVATASNGSFTINSVPSGSYVIQVTPPTNSSAPTGFSYPYYHAAVAVSGTTALATIKLDLLTSDDQAWIVKTNSDRASYGAAALKADETATIAARAWANQLAIDPTIGHGTTTTRNSATPSSAALAQILKTLALTSSIGTWPNIETAWMAEP